VNKKVKALAVLITVLFGLSVCINAADSSLMPVSDSNLIRVAAADTVWQKTFGGAHDDRAYYSLPTQNGNFLVVGTSQSIVDNTTVGWALMLDCGGNMVWNRTFLDGFGTELRYALSVQGGYLLVGNQFNPGGDENGYVAKVNAQGNLLWNTTVGTENLDKIFCATASADGYVLFGLTYIAYDHSNAWAVKLDFNGNAVWNKTYDANAFRCAVASEDGGTVVAGYASSRAGDYDFAVYQLDASGNVVWNRAYGGTDDEKACSITKASDGYVIVGDMDSQATSTDAWVVKLGLNGSLLWQKTVGGKEADSPAYVTSSRDGGYLVAGFTFSYGKGYRDFWLFKVNDAGQVVWSCTVGTDSFQEAYGVVEQGPDSYVMVGWTDPSGHPELVGKKTYDFYIVNLAVNQQDVSLSSIQWAEYVFMALALVASWALISSVYVSRKNRLKTKQPV
jgi:hypothetical protein